MARNTATEDDPIDDKYRPIYEFRKGVGAGFGSTVDTVPREDQIEALRSVAGEGPVEPDGWFHGYNGGSLPVLDGVPITVIEHSTPINSRSEGVETSNSYAVDNSLGPVELHKAFAHPGNTSKIKVREKK
jgi:hypothetical protein